MNWKLDIKILKKKISNIFKVLKLTCSILRILKFPALGQVESIKDYSHVIPILEITDVL